MYQGRGRRGSNEPKTSLKVNQEKFFKPTAKVDERQNYICVYKGEDKDGKEYTYTEEVYANDFAHAMKLGSVYGSVASVKLP